MKKVYISVDWKLLDDLSYKTNLGKSLRNTLRKFDKENLFDELSNVIEFFMESSLEEKLPYEQRVKSLQSCVLKYNKYYPSKEVEKVFNDILGIRIVIDDYSLFDALELPEQVRIADMREGKANDDGYRGIHLYFQKDHYHYPIEIQFMTASDKQFNEWLHIRTYKYVSDNKVGSYLRTLYEEGKIISEEDFRKELENVLSNSKEI